MNNKLLSFFGFTRMPFTKEITVNEIFKSNVINGLLAMFELCISTEDIMLIHGEIGCGKSVALRLLIHSLDANKYNPLYLKSSRMKVSHLYNAILTGLKVEPPFRFHNAKQLYRIFHKENCGKPLFIGV